MTHDFPPRQGATQPAEDAGLAPPAEPAETASGREFYDTSMRLLRSYAGHPEQQFGRNLRTVREKQGLTQQAVAELMTFFGLPMQQTTIAKIEAAQRPLRLNEVVVLCSAYGFPELMAGVFGPIAFGDRTMNQVRTLMEGETELITALRRAERGLRQQMREYMQARLAALDAEDRRDDAEDRRLTAGRVSTTRPAPRPQGEA